MHKKAVYPGSFDPITNGHLDVLERACQVFDHVVMAVLINPQKESMFTLQERVDLLENSTKHIKNVSFDSFTGLLVEYCRSLEINSIVRGLRAVNDFEYELQMAQLNRTLAPEIETVFLVANHHHSFVSSSLVKQVANLGGEIDALVPPYAVQKIHQKLQRR